MFFPSFNSPEQFKSAISKDAHDAFEIPEGEMKHIGSTLFGEFMGRTSRGESWESVIKDLEEKHPEYDVKVLIEGVADTHLLPWRNLQ